MIAPGPLDLASASQIAKVLKSQWRDGEPPDTLRALARHPQLREDRVVYVDLAFLEFLLRQDAGEKLDANAYCERFPEIQASLRLSLDAAKILGENPEIIPETPSAAAPPSAPPPPPAPAANAKDKGPWLESGTTLGDLTVLRQLGHGEFSRVYLATEGTAGGRAVVVKFSCEGAQEANTLGRLHHEHIVPIHWAEYDKEIGYHVVCMPFLGSATLHHILAYLNWHKGASRKQGTAILEAIRATVHPGDPTPIPSSAGPRLESLSFSDAVERLAEQLADALAFLHAKGLVHRDLKPSNILLTPGGRPLLLDFNLSKATGVPTEDFAGTFAYMAPEKVQAWTDKRVLSLEAESQAELYSLAVILYELLTGQHPLGALPYHLDIHQWRHWVSEHQKTDPAPIRELNPAVSPHLASLLDACLSRDPAKRPAGAAALAAQLRSPRRKRGWLIASAAAVLLTLATALPFGLSQLGAGQGGDRENEASVEPPRDPDEVARSSRTKAKQRVAEAWELLRKGKKAEAQPLLKEAVDAYNRAIEKKGEWQDYAGKGRALMLLDEFKQAEGVFYAAKARFPPVALPRGGRAVDPHLARMLACLSYCLARNRLHESAVVVGEEALRAGFDSPALRNNLGYSCVQKGDWEKAENHLARALSGKPNLLPALRNQAFLAGRGGDPPERALKQMVDVIDGARKQGLDTAALYKEAVRLYACAIHHSRARGKANDKAVLDRTKEYVRLACARGADIADFRTVDLYKQVLGQDFLDRLPHRQVTDARKEIPVDIRLVDPLGFPLP